MSVVENFQETNRHSFVLLLLFLDLQARTMAVDLNLALDCRCILAEANKQGGPKNVYLHCDVSRCVGGNCKNDSRTA